jgi:hypothetical protein
MSMTAVTNWFAFLNALKFINIKEKTTGVKIKEKEIDARSIISYIKSVGGDLYMNLKHRNGIPFKYSLATNHDGSRDIAEINYDF